MLPRLFDVFAQADRTLERSHGGLGLGLSLVKELVELHGGSVAAESAGMGAGAAFSVRLPREREPVALAHEADPGALSPGRVRVVVVEDHRDAAESMRMLLEAHGYEVAVARSGPAGV